MRLLERRGYLDFSLTDDILDKDILEYPYAILSHRWGEPNDEVTFENMKNGSGRYKSGYKKIEFCGEQAFKDGLIYFWVDSCCIKRSSDSELSEAINSMYRWYSRAKRCYVYLADVSVVEEDAHASETLLQGSFRDSDWFSRGWTLQELLAPGNVQFFSRERRSLGDKTSLSAQIHEITGIAISALQGSPLSDFSVEERFEWAQNRCTTREEDWAYCLLGIFDISMPLIYGEGRDRAVNRLRKEINTLSEELFRRLPVANDAPFNALAKQHEPSCLQNTRVDLLQYIFDWANGQDERCIFWLNGLAGTGKSTVARTVARHYFDQKRLGASFFFARGGGDVGNAGRFVTSIALQLANNVRGLRQNVFDAVSENSDITSLSLRDQWQTLVIAPMSKLRDSSTNPSYVIVVDALDECDDENTIQILVQLLAEIRSLTIVKLRVLLTSRSEVPVRYGFCKVPEKSHRDFVLHGISRSVVDHDIFVFLEYNLNSIAKERSLPPTWPGDNAINSMVQIASGLFIWAATACRFIREGQRFATRRLDTILKDNRIAAIGPEKHLDAIYSTVLEHAIPPQYTDEEKQDAYDMLRYILGSLAALFSPLSISSLRRLLCLSSEDMNQTLEDLHSVLDISQNEDWPLRLHHPSFRDFLFSEARSKQSRFRTEEKQAHRILADHCIRVMSSSLKQDICAVKSPGKLAAELDHDRIDHVLPPEIQYACLYWVQHLQKSDIQLHDHDQVHQFLEAHLLHWFEALSYLQKVAEGVHSVILLESIALRCNCAEMQAFVHDVKRFTIYNKYPIERAPLQLYSSALIFAPAKSIVKKHFAHEVPGWVQSLSRASEDWSAAVATLEGHNDSVNAVAFSLRGKLLASASRDHTVRLWDGDTGSAITVLVGHTGWVNAVAFSPDGERLASASDDKTIRVWSSEAVSEIAILEGHSDPVSDVVFSPNGGRLASASYDHSIRLWDGDNGMAICTLEGHTGWVSSVVFSPNSKRLASASHDHTVRLWDGETGSAVATLKSHSGWINALDFSPDSKQLASASHDKRVQVWDSNNGDLLKVLEGHNGSVSDVVFSSDGKRLASASRDKTVRLWNSETGACVATLKGHSGWVNAVVFDGSRLASASDDRVIRLWDAETGAAIAALEGHGDLVSAIAYSPDGKRLASASRDKTVRLWDSEVTALPATPDNPSGSVNAIVFSPDDKRFASASDSTIHLWNGETGAAVATLKGHDGLVTAIKFSPDGRRLASASRDQTVRLWNEEGMPIATLDGHNSWVNTIAFSPDSKLLASGSDDKTVRLWDGQTGVSIDILKGYGCSVSVVAFSLDGRRLASGSRDNVVRLIEMGMPMREFEGHSDWINAVAFSPDGKRLASASDDETVCLWNESGVAIAILKGHHGWVSAVAFSPDGTRLASASHDNTIRLWHGETGTSMATFELGVTIHELSFTTDGSHLMTDHGLIGPISIESCHILQKQSCLFVSERWITLDSQRLIWLPRDYRATATVLKEHRMILGHSSGRISHLVFDLRRLATWGQ